MSVSRKNITSVCRNRYIILNQLFADLLPIFLFHEHQVCGISQDVQSPSYDKDKDQAISGDYLFTVKVHFTLLL